MPAMPSAQDDQRIAVESLEDAACLRLITDADFAARVGAARRMTRWATAGQIHVPTLALVLHASDRDLL